MCNFITRRTFSGLLVATLITPQFAIADNTKVINVLNGQLNIDELVLLESAVGRQPHWELLDAKMHFLSPKLLPVI